jgi:hypothetical protein
MSPDLRAYCDLLLCSAVPIGINWEMVRRRDAPLIVDERGEAGLK